MTVSFDRAPDERLTTRWRSRSNNARRGPIFGAYLDESPVMLCRWHACRDRNLGNGTRAGCRRFSQQRLSAINTPVGDHGTTSQTEIEKMILKTLFSAVAVLAGVTTVSLAQSQPNCGSNAPAVGDTFGKPPTGTRDGTIGAERCRTQAVHRGWHRHAHRHWHARFSSR